jgi:ATP-binding cassette, subfamily B, bacterial PglK
MIKTLKKIFLLLNKEYKKKLLQSQILLIFSAIFEMLGIISIVPLMQLISNADIINDSSHLITKVYIYLDISSYSNFLIIISISMLCIFFINFLLSVYTIYFTTKFSWEVGNYLKSKIFKIYSSQPWIFHSQRETSSYVNKIQNETSRISNAAILPLLQVNAKLIISLTIIVFIFFYNPVISTVCFFIFSIAYVLIFKVIKKKIYSDGLVLSTVSEVMYKKILETFGGIKETILHKKQEKFHNEFMLEANKYAKSIVSIQFFQSSPRLFLEFIAFSVIVVSIIYTSLTGLEENLDKTLPVLAVYIFAGYKILPMFQNIYFGLLSLKSCEPAIDSIYNEINGKNSFEFKKEKSLLNKDFTLEDKIELKNISFSYEDNNKPAIQNLSLNIPLNSFVSIVGASGAGKSTVLDIILGLLAPKQGEVLIDGHPLSSIVENYQQNISYVGQNIFLNNDSIKNNICFGVNQNDIDEKKLSNAIKASNLLDLVNELPEGIDTKIGERGVKISGGQQQRVAIARALYLDRNIIILDEATSSLDGISENNILKRLKLFSEEYKKTIIMVTHNINLTRYSDIIHLINKGSLVKSGDFNTLLNNDIFKKLLNEQ